MTYGSISNTSIEIEPYKLLDPLSISTDYVNDYKSKMKMRSTEELQDDLSMIWIVMPKDGYGDIKPLVLELREALRNELNQRPCIHWRERLEFRLEKQKKNSNE